MKKFSLEWMADKEKSTPWCADYLKTLGRQVEGLEDLINNETCIVFFEDQVGVISPVGVISLVEQGNDEFDFVFCYDPEYVASDNPAISVTLPKQNQISRTHNQIHPYFDNLCSEGWLSEAQNKSISQSLHIENVQTRYRILALFSRSNHGAVSLTYAKIDEAIDPLPNHLQRIALQPRSTLTGMWPKGLGVTLRDTIIPSGYFERSEWIIKYPMQTNGYGTLDTDGLQYEYLGNLAMRAYLPHDEFPECRFFKMGIGEELVPVLAIKRFDRLGTEGKRHFEELNQVFGEPESRKYDGAGYEDVAKIVAELVCEDARKRIFQRFTAQLLCGITDSHLKNFGLFHDGDNKFSLTPNYDLNPNYFSGLEGDAEIALQVKGRNLPKINELKLKNLVIVGEQMGLTKVAIYDTIITLRNNGMLLEETLLNDENPLVRGSIKSNYIDHLRKWNSSMISASPANEKYMNSAFLKDSSVLQYISKNSDIERR
ncbi:MAG: type II toxin-antitoxin system HipA family toxin [Alphaproteobacteria bacterium]|jgi:HipA-like protein|nr:type II toxin-antitoxin system HipA family toxin [Alphaproteobacteria bacterium]